MLFVLGLAVGSLDFETGEQDAILDRLALGESELCFANRDFLSFVAVDFSFLIPRILPQQKFANLQSSGRIHRAPLFASALFPIIVLTVANHTGPLTLVSDSIEVSKAESLDRTLNHSAS